MQPGCVVKRMSRLAAALLFLFLLVPAAAPLSAAALPFVEAEPVTAWRAFLDDGRVCSAFDPVTRLLELPTLSTLAHGAAGAATAYTLALRPPASEGCPDLTLSFSSPVAWANGSGSVSAECGLAGELLLEDHVQEVVVILDATVPAECDAGYAGVVRFQGTVVRPRTDDGQTCVPYTPVGHLCRRL